MKKFLSLLVLCYVSFSAFSLIPNRFSGSVICDNLSISYSLPDSLQKPFYYHTSVTVSDTSNDLFIDYYLETGDGESDVLKEIEIDLNDKFASVSLERLKVSWGVHEDIYVNNNKLPDSEFVLFQETIPGADCYQTKSTCNEIKVFRNSIREVCSHIIYHKTELNRYEVGDSLYIRFKDSTEYTEQICLAEGSFIHTDSAKITGLENKKYDVFYEFPIDVYCVTIPCPTFYDNEYLASYDFSDCVINSFKDFNKESVAEYYPNPASDVLIIPEYSGEIELTNQMGFVYRIKGNEKFRVNELPTGVYLISTVGENQKRMGKVVIQ